MNRDLKLLITEVEDKMEHPHQAAAGMEQRLTDVCRHKTGGKGLSLSRIWKMLAGKGSLSAEAKDRLALLAGFQSWDDFKDALHGNADAQINYEDDAQPASPKKNPTEK